MLTKECHPVHKLWTNTHKWEVIDYFDVWHNEEEGYWVNNQAVVIDDLIMTEDTSNEENFNYLKDIAGIFGPEAKFEDMNFDGDDYYIEVSTTVNDEWYPLCRLQRR